MFGKKYKKILIIEGMHCQHCASTIKNSLSRIESITKVKTNLEKQTVEIISKKQIDNDEINNIFSELDYKIKEIK